jgi:hypothetical protein
MLHDHCWTLPIEDPDPAKNGFESNTMLIKSRQLHCRFRSSLLDQLERLREFFK